jgi:aminoglycoside/choline kinase family phosphotransferase
MQDNLLHKETLCKLFIATFGGEIHTFSWFDAHASSRMYSIISNGDTEVIGTYGDMVNENSNFIRIARFLNTKGILVPKIHAVDSSGKYYLQENLGKVDLFHIIKTKFDDIELYLKKSVDTLVGVQSMPDNEFDYSACYPFSVYDKKGAENDIVLFERYFLSKEIECTDVAYKNDIEKILDIFSSISESQYVFMNHWKAVNSPEDMEEAEVFVTVHRLK